MAEAVGDSEQHEAEAHDAMPASVNRQQNEAQHDAMTGMASRTDYLLWRPLFCEGFFFSKLYKSPNYFQSAAQA